MKTYGQPKAPNFKKPKDATAPKVKKFSHGFLGQDSDDDSESDQSTPSHYGDESDDSYWFTSDDEGEDDDDEDPEETSYKRNRLIMFGAYTHYNVIKEVAKFSFDYHLTKKEFCNFDLYWCDGPIGL